VGLVRIIDEVLPAALHRRLLRAVTALGDGGMTHGYQRTFWFPRDAEPCGVVEEAVVFLRERLLGPGAGEEWWLSRMRTSNVPIDFHRDRDQARARAGQGDAHPTRSSVLMLNRCRGGLLAVSPSAPDLDEPACAPRARDFDLVEPRPNRLVSFDGTLTHGVLDARNHVPLQRLPKEPGLRLTIAVNTWAKPIFEPRSFRQSRAYPALRKSG